MRLDPSTRDLAEATRCVPLTMREYLLVECLLRRAAGTTECEKDESGALDRRPPVSGDDEFDMLAHLVNHRLDEVERLMGEVKGTCDGIAHDLGTPLVHLHTDAR